MTRALLLLIGLSVGIHAQRLFEKDGRVLYEDTANRPRRDLGPGFSSTLLADGSVVFLRGRKFDYGDKFDCANPSSRNPVIRYDPATGETSTLFDKTIHFSISPELPFCVFAQMQISHDASTLYLFARTYVTAGSLAIIKLPSGSMKFIDGVAAVWIIGSGPHLDELICVERELGDFATYPLVHTRPDGSRIKVISDEWPGLSKDTPKLRSYLREIDGTIRVGGQQLP
jgi:hypothetical protein